MMQSVLPNFFLWGILIKDTFGWCENLQPKHDWLSNIPLKFLDRDKSHNKVDLKSGVHIQNKFEEIIQSITKRPPDSKTCIWKKNWKEPLVQNWIFLQHTIPLQSINVWIKCDVRKIKNDRNFLHFKQSYVSYGYYWVGGKNVHNHTNGKSHIKTRGNLIEAWMRTIKIPVCHSGFIGMRGKHAREGESAARRRASRTRFDAILIRPKLVCLLMPFLSWTL